MDKRSDSSTSKLRTALWGSVGFLLLIPLVAMQFTDEVNWGLMDFIVAGLLLSLAAFTYELAATKFGNSKARLAAGIAILAVLILIWIELAVGLFD
ncbi:MAG: hypothetical protein HN995_06415 [Candidatus Marinimicrobia bacterium]|nr:hypothetical protein [Candidatus Neomarinimicrobiota bacterium]MBT3575905.1 hypothetical protein [Candidatus Neomarinimicrobiota bacterium]MBT3679398.1 hypothetical protein [Candidatus Neomarinimicrobiota bacterium]MBT3951133.1 hypothetical protein [Candidatus Neomarinimicrobiota bacterium]MBT4254187.1 hypothetical protein [Candidatus Neomarinimicrobiota bacterium]